MAWEFGDPALVPKPGVELIRAFLDEGKFLA